MSNTRNYKVSQQQFQSVGDEVENSRVCKQVQCPNRNQSYNVVGDKMQGIGGRRQTEIRFDGSRDREIVSE
jgi:hypothetical protein